MEINYDDFKNRLPIVSYENIYEEIERCRKGEQNIFWPSPIKWFAKSSGTTNSKSKFIPISTESLEDCHYKAGKDMLSIYYNNNENAQILAGKCLRLGGSSELYQNTNSYFGDLSAIIIDNLPFWAELGSTPSYKVSLMPEWEAKMEAIIDETLDKKVTSLAGVPSWMLVLLQNVLRKTKKTSINEVWPFVEVYFHGGVSFHPYREQFEKLFLGRFPIMLQSDLCILQGLDRGVRFNMGECKNDYGGYFIIDGKEKVIISQEKFADNMLYIRENYNEIYKY